MIFAATIDQLDLSPPHPPKEHAIEAFEHVQHEIKAAILASRHDWNKHEPRMWALAAEASDHDLVDFTIKVMRSERRSLASALTCQG